MREGTKGKSEQAACFSNPQKGSKGTRLCRLDFPSEGALTRRGGGVWGVCTIRQADGRRSRSKPRDRSRSGGRGGEAAAGGLTPRTPRTPRGRELSTSSAARSISPTPSQQQVAAASAMCSGDLSHLFCPPAPLPAVDMPKKHRPSMTHGAPLEVATTTTKPRDGAAPSDCLSSLRGGGGDQNKQRAPPTPHTPAASSFGMWL